MSLYHRFKDRFGTAGVVLGVIAIVLAVGGSAIAASGLNGKQKKEVKAIAKSFQGTGPAGAAGTNGTNGTNGKDGAPGAKGDNGTNGTNGTDGEDGKSVEAFEIDPGPTDTQCDEEGGAEYEIEDSAEPATVICNGSEGSPWTAGGTLPPGATETGAWSFIATAAGETYAPISFSIPLAAELDGGQTHFSTEGSFGTFCDLTVNAEGEQVLTVLADETLCVKQYEHSPPANGEFLQVSRPSGASGSSGAGRYGAVLYFETSGVFQTAGIWAVRG